MSTSTYLDVVNTVLGEMNEVKLSSADFTSAVGFQAYVKDAVNRVLNDINTENYKWPFLSTGNSTEPHLGNAVINCVEGQRWYDIKSGSLSIDTDYGFVDWDTFFLTTYGVAGETAPYTTYKLTPTSLLTWQRIYASSEADAKFNNSDYGMPLRFFKSRNGRQIGVSPLPDKAYKIYFFAYDQIASVSAATATFPFQEQFVQSVLIPGVRKYAWMFKENETQRQVAEEDYKKGLRRMREILKEDIEKAAMLDDRIRVV